MEHCSYQISDEDLAEFKRLDQFITKKLTDKSRSYIKNLFEKGLITIADESPYKGKLELKRMPPSGTIINIHLPPPIPTKAQAEDIPLEILYEDEHLAFVNKPAGMVTHPAPGNYTGTLVNAILYHCKDLQGIGDEIRPGIVHRLDKGTSGVMVVAKSAKCHEGLVNLFSTHDIERKYIALAMGKECPAQGKLEASIGRHPNNRLKMAANVKNGKDAITYYKVLETFEKMSLLEMTLETGRTHQIRVHLNELLHRPILCDPLYGNPKEHLNRLGKDFKEVIGEYPHPFLHARLLGFVHPITKEKLLFEVEPPQIFKDVIALGKKLNG